jgi:hypothetical protein
LNRSEEFTTAYPQEIFQEQARLIKRKECLLLRRYKARVSGAEVSAEIARIEMNTRAPEVWAAVKRALDGNPDVIGEVVCRPLVVDRALRSYFSADRALHSQAWADIVLLRRRLVNGRKPIGPAAFLDVSVCESEGRPNQEANACHGIGGAVAQELAQSFKRHEAVSPILEDEEFFYVARVRETDRLLADGFTSKKRDYMAWLRACTCEGF